MCFLDKKVKTESSIKKKKKKPENQKVEETEKGEYLQI